MSDTKTLCEMLETIEGGIDKLSQQNVALEIKLMQSVEIIKHLLWDLRNPTYDPAKDVERAENFIDEYNKREKKIHINTTTISDAPLMEVENDCK